MTAPYDQNAYRATILRHVDADTTEVEVDLGFDVRTRLTVRWAGIDAPERNTLAGKASLAWLMDALPPGTSCELRTIKDRKEKYGRYLGTFWLPGAVFNVNTWMIDEGFAQPYQGGPR